MKYLTIALIFLASTAIACKKKVGQYCYYQAMKDGAPNGSPSIYIWRVNKPSNDQVQKVQDSCRCTVTIIETCVPCDAGYTDPSGNDIDCD